MTFKEEIADYLTIPMDSMFWTYTNFVGWRPNHYEGPGFWTWIVGRRSDGQFFVSKAHVLGSEDTFERRTEEEIKMNDDFRLCLRFDAVAFHADRRAS